MKVSRATPVLFLEVDSLDAAIAALAQDKAIVERHKTFHDADEISSWNPAGTS